MKKPRPPRMSLSLKPMQRDMLRALCHEFDLDGTQVIGQLIRAEYLALFPRSPVPKNVPLRGRDSRSVRKVQQVPANDASDDTDDGSSSQSA